MLSKPYKVLIIPIQISKFVYDKGLIKPFAIYLYLKIFAGDKVSADDEIFTRLQQDLNMSDPKGRTFRKHFKKLIDLNWIGYNAKTAIYHIRSFDYIRAENGYKKRWATRLFLKDILQLQVYLVGALLCAEIYDQIYFWEKARGRSRTATSKRDVANQSKTSRCSSKPPYYGLSNHKIARLLGCQPTRACQLKQAAVEAKYIKTLPHFEDIAELSKADYNLRHQVAQRQPVYAKRIRFIKVENGEQQSVRVVRQMHDEIIPNIVYKRVSGFASLKVPFGVLKVFLTDKDYIKAA